MEVGNSIFRNNSADGLDLDYVSGQVSNSIFTHNGNDGIDLSGSKVIIKNNRIERSEDKCISIGERSFGTVVFNNILENCNIGIEVKDGSGVIVINSIISNNGIGINAYMKKPIYMSGGEANIYNSIIENNEIQAQKDDFSEIQYHEDGNVSVLKEYLGIEADQAPVGLWKNF